MTKSLKIFIAGPYGDHLPKETIQANIAKADEIGRQIALKGHSPLIPHKMLQGWEDDPRFKTEDFMKIDLDWLKQADALFYIGPSKGADRELALAKKLKKKIFYRIEEVPEVKSSKSRRR